MSFVTMMRTVVLLSAVSLAVVSVPRNGWAGDRPGRADVIAEFATNSGRSQNGRRRDQLNQLVLWNPLAQVKLALMTGRPWLVGRLCFDPAATIRADPKGRGVIVEGSIGRRVLDRAGADEGGFIGARGDFATAKILIRSGGLFGLKKAYGRLEKIAGYMFLGHTTE